MANHKPEKNCTTNPGVIGTGSGKIGTSHLNIDTVPKIIPIQITAAKTFLIFAFKFVTPLLFLLDSYNIQLNVRKVYRHLCHIPWKQGVHMNNYKHFGELLEQLRLQNQMTQSEVAEGICTLRQYSRIEKGESTPRIDILYALSAKYNTNLYEYYNVHFSHLSFEAFHYICKLNDASAVGDISSFQPIADEMEQLKEFETGDNFKYLCYAHALAEFYKPDLDCSIQYCLKGLELKDFNSFRLLSSQKVYTNAELCLMNCLGCTFIAKKSYEEADFTLHKLIEIFDYQAALLPFPSGKGTNFLMNIYENTVYNIAIYKYHMKDYNEACIYAQKGVDHSINHNDILYLPMLLQIKAYSLMQLELYDEAKKCSQQAITLFELTMNACLNDNKPELGQWKYNQQKTLLDELNAAVQMLEKAKKHQEEQAEKAKKSKKNSQSTTQATNKK